jgi:hypothetical protein
VYSANLAHIEFAISVSFILYPVVEGCSNVKLEETHVGNPIRLLKFVVPTAPDVPVCNMSQTSVVVVTEETVFLIE